MAKDDDDLPSATSALAHERAEREETEDLLSGFDRPQRSPRRLSADGSDFVAYHDRDSSDGRVRFVVREPSLVVPKNEVPAVVKWAAVIVLAVSIAGTSAWLLTPGPTATKLADPPQPPSTTSPWVPPPTPVATAPVTTITTATLDDETAVPAAVLPPSRPATRKDTKPQTTAAAATKPPARSDFVRDL
jgi:hypothetical protein